MTGIVGWLLGVGAGLIVLYAVVVLAIVAVSMRPPRVFQFLSPGQMGVPQQDLVLETEDGLRLGAWWCESGDEVVLVACHGYIVNRCEFAPYSLAWTNAGYSCLFFDFRGHGRSQGALVTIGHHERRDVAAAVKEARRRKPKAKIILVGSSMGAAASVMYAGEHPGEISGLFLDGSYSRLDHALRGWWSFIAGPWLGVLMAPSVWVARVFLREDPRKVDPTLQLGRFSGPVLLVYGDRDEICPPDQVEKMRQAAGPESELEWFADCGHGGGRYRDPARYTQLTLDFFEKVRRQGDAAGGPPLV